ncbi:MAG: hypothetical protein JXQ80_02510 [Bacteroidales bacterium]|nr:hypothetical protein [Bacteroidales bacterium]
MKAISDDTQTITVDTEFEQYRLQVKESLLSRFHSKPDTLNYLERVILSESNRDVLVYISEQLDIRKYFGSIIVTTCSCSYLDHVDFDNLRAIINLEPASPGRKPGKVFRAVNTLLPDAGIFIGKTHVNYSVRACSKLIRNGFDIVDMSLINGSLYFTAIKTSEPCKEN